MIKQKVNTRWIKLTAAFAAACTCAPALYAASSPMASGSTDRVGFRQQVLEIHNRARGEAGVSPLQWSSDLEVGARAHAQRLANASRLFHSDGSSGSGMGENLWAGTRGAYDVHQMFEVMVGEGRDFRPGRFPQVSRTGQWRDVGHYTQMIWPTTQKVGCAVAANASDEFLVCRYYPSGNVIGYTLR